MDSLVFLIPIALGLGGLALAGFIWAVRSGQYDDPDGAANRILIDQDVPLLEKRGASRADAETSKDFDEA